jgi:glycosyltransferase involved in cell wall biosynthesis
MDNVEFLGFLNSEELKGMYLKSDFFIMPSYYEGMPLALLEAMSCGCIPVVSLLDDITDRIIINEKNGYLLNNTDVKRTAQIISDLSENHSKMEILSRNANQTIQNKFSLKETGINYNLLIARLTENKKNKNKRMRNFFGIDYSPISTRNFVPSYLRKKLKKLFPNQSKV